MSKEFPVARDLFIIISFQGKAINLSHEVQIYGDWK
jgi:hypothetical protein